MASPIWYKIELPFTINLFLIKNHVLHIVASRQVTIFDISRPNIFVLQKSNVQPNSSELKQNFGIEYATEVLDTGVRCYCYDHITDWQDTFDGTQFGATIYYAHTKNVMATSEETKSLMVKLRANKIYQLVLACHYQDSIWALDNQGTMYCNEPVHVRKVVWSLFTRHWQKQQWTDVKFVQN